MQSLDLLLLLRMRCEEDIRTGLPLNPFTYQNCHRLTSLRYFPCFAYYREVGYGAISRRLVGALFGI